MLRDTIAQCKARLPMPDLWPRIGLQGEPKRSCKSPFREDKEPSFSVFQVGQNWFYKDHATGESGDEIGLIQRHLGCDKEEAIRFYHELAGVEMEQPRRSQTAATVKRDFGKIAAVYDYQSEDGKLVHQTVRFEPKRFLQRRPAAPGMRAGNKEAKKDPNGNWWIWTLDGIEPVLYRLPQLLAEPDKTVVICEGEKDADALAEAEPRFLTTTAPMGAGKWRKSYTEALRGRNVIVAGQLDKVGQRHVLKVANDLTGVAAMVRRLIWNKLVPGVIDGQKIDIHDFLAGITQGCAA